MKILRHVLIIGYCVTVSYLSLTWNDGNMETVTGYELRVKKKEDC